MKPDKFIMCVFLNKLYSLVAHTSVVPRLSLHVNEKSLFHTASDEKLGGPGNEARPILISLLTIHTAISHGLLHT